MSKDVETSGKYVLPSKLNYEDYLTAIGQRAQDSYGQAVKDAETARQKEVLAAGNAYRSALANSGANAQALSSMGLTGSGYSTYLDSQAYAQKQGAVNNAYKNKQSAVNLAKTSLDSALSDVEGLYADYLVKKEADRKNAYQGIYDKLPTLSLGDIERLGATMGLDQPDIDALKAAKNDMTYASLLGTEYGLTDVDNLVAAGKLYYNNINDEDPLNAAYIKLINNAKALTPTDIDGIFDGEDYATAKNTLDSIINSGKVRDKATLDALQKEFDKAYKSKTADVTFKKDGGRDRPGTKGNNIKLEGADGTIYRVQYNGDELDDKNNVANKLSAGTVFMYNGVVYVKHSNGKCYAVEARPANSNYNDLVKLFEESNKKTEGGSNTGTNTQNPIETNRFTAPVLPGYE